MPMTMYAEDTDTMPGKIVLEDGRVFEGSGFGAEGVQTGELVFNTSMTGYQEILTDPSYYKQIVTMTVAHVGNTGINLEDVESARVWVSGFVVRSLSSTVSNWREQGRLEDYLAEQGVIGVSDVATRALVRHIRSTGGHAGGDCATARRRSIPLRCWRRLATRWICPARIWSIP